MRIEGGEDADTIVQLQALEAARAELLVHIGEELANHAQDLDREAISTATSEAMREIARAERELREIRRERAEQMAERDRIQREMREEMERERRRVIEIRREANRAAAERVIETMPSARFEPQPPPPPEPYRH